MRPAAGRSAALARLPLHPNHPIPAAVPGGPGDPLADHTLQFVASLISQGAQIVAIRHSGPFVLA